MRKFAKFGLCALAVLGLASMAHADTGVDPSAIVDQATSTISTVETAVAGVVGFFIVVKIVKWIRK